MRWLHINHRGPMWPRVGLFIRTKGGQGMYDPGVDLVLAYTRPGRVEWRDLNNKGRTFAARRRYWVRFSWNPWFKFRVVHGVTPADEKS